jgi:hypothetical protein
MDHERRSRRGEVECGEGVVEDVACSTRAQMSVESGITGLRGSRTSATNSPIVGTTRKVGPVSRPAGLRDLEEINQVPLHCSQVQICHGCSVPCRLCMCRPPRESWHSWVVVGNCFSLCHIIAWGHCRASRAHPPHNPCNYSDNARHPEHVGPHSKRGWMDGNATQRNC